MDGILGYELDSTKMTAEEKQICKRQIEEYKKYYHLIAEGDYYRLTNPFQFREYTAWQHVSGDRREALVSLVLTEKESNDAQRYLKLKGLKAEGRYRVSGMPGIYSGRLLMSAGIPVPGSLLEYEAAQFYLEEITEDGHE